MAYLPKSKKTFFKDSSNGKKAFPGGLKGPKQPKVGKKIFKHKIKQKKQYIKESPQQPMTQAHRLAPHKRQEHLVGVPKQPKFYNDAEFMARLRRATS